MMTHNIVGAQLAARILDVGSASADLGAGGLKSALQRGIGIALVALFLAAPGTALADDECGLQIDSGNPESFDCPDADYDNGVTYTTDGNLTLNFTNGTRSDIGGVSGDGIGVTGQGADSVTIDSATSATELDSDGVTEALVGVTTVDGNIDIAADFLDADFAPTTHGIFAQSTGTGSIDITTTGTVDAQSGTNPTDSIGIEAITNSGNITVTTGGFVRGNQYGVRAEAGGAGTLNIVVGDDIDVDSTNGMAAIDATTGTGDLVIDILFTDATDSVNGQNGSAIITNAGGNAEINIASERRVTNQSSGGEAVLNVTAAGETVINNDGSISPNGVGQAIRATGGSLILNNNDLIFGSIDFSGLSGNGSYTFNNNAEATWQPGTDVESDLGEGILNNAGTIVFDRRDIAGAIGQTDFVATVVSAPGSTFTGTGESTLEMPVFLGGIGQEVCGATALAACLDLTGGTTAGQTAVLIRGAATTLVTGPLTAVSSANPGIVLIDVGGGTSSADHFVLHPDSSLVIEGTVGIYETDPIYGAVMDVGGVLDYALLYNPNTQQHLLASVPSPQAVEYAFFIDEMLSVWHTTSETVAGRQAELRDGATGRLWFRAVGQESERDAAPTFTSQGNTFTYDRGYSLSTQELMVGADLISGENHVFGLHVGVVTAKLEFDHSETFDDVDGANFGAYGGWWHDSGLSLDGAVTATFLKLEHDIAGDFEKTEIDTLTAGARLEAGWRLPLAEEALYVQPLATAAYARSDIDNVELQDNTLSFEDGNSMRTGLGLRLGGETALDNDRAGKLGYWLTARHWEEHESDGRVEFATQGGQPLAIEDDLSGSYEQVDLGVSVSNADDTLSGFLSGGAQFADDKLGDSYNVSAGVRMNW